MRDLHGSTQDRVCGGLPSSPRTRRGANLAEALARAWVCARVASILKTVVLSSCLQRENRLCVAIMGRGLGYHAQAIAPLCPLERSRAPSAPSRQWRAAARSASIKQAGAAAGRYRCARVCRLPTRQAHWPGGDACRVRRREGIITTAKGSCSASLPTRRAVLACVEVGEAAE